MAHDPELQAGEPAGIGRVHGFKLANRLGQLNLSFWVDRKRGSSMACPSFARHDKSPGRSRMGQKLPINPLLAMTTFNNTLEILNCVFSTQPPDSTGFKTLTGRKQLRVLRGTSAPALENHGLSKRQLVILRLLAEGMRNKQIARHLNLSHLTVQTHLKEIFRRLNVHTRTGAVIKGLSLGILGPADGDKSSATSSLSSRRKSLP